ncbi:hypothetical protein PENTCL1PPCAC_28648, partial [Pristionchus entomophagus]
MKTSYAAMAPYSTSTDNMISPDETIIFDPISVRISGVDEKHQTIEVILKANIEWQDYRLTWNPYQYGGINEVFLSRESIWRPAILPCNFTSLVTDDNEKGHILVSSSGHATDTVMWFYVAPVEIDLHKFPFDDHPLALCFDALAMEKLGVKLVGSDKNKSIDECGSEWKIIKHLEVDKSKLNSNVTILFNITLERYSNFWVNLVIIPCFVLGFLIIAGLVLNADTPSVESVVNIGLASTVSTAVVIGTMTDNFPKTNKIPSLGSFVRNQILIILVAIITLSIRRSLMSTIETVINYLERDAEEGCSGWRKWLVNIIKFARYRYFLFIVFELAHLGCFL